MMEDDPLRLAKQELIAAWDAIDRMCATQDFQVIELNYRNVLNHVEKLWVKAERASVALGGRFSNWQRPYRNQRSQDPLLSYFRHARNADNHTAQDISYLVTGHLILGHKFAHLKLLQKTCPAVDEFVDRGLAYKVPEMHLGTELNTKDPRHLSVYVCNFYAEYLRELQQQFFTPQGSQRNDSKCN